MHRGADIAKQMRASGLRIEARRGFPIHPTDVVLLGGEKDGSFKFSFQARNSCPEIQAWVSWLMARETWDDCSRNSIGLI